MVSRDRVHEQKDIAYHEIIGSEYDSVVVAPRLTINDQVLSACTPHLHGGDTMLDLGCGTGHATLRFGHLFRSVIAIDHSSAMQEIARANVQHVAMQQVQFVNQNVLAFLESFPSGTADSVCCIGFLHHLTELQIEEVLVQAAKALKPSGTLLISEPRIVDPESTPPEIAAWNASSVQSLGSRLHYSREAMMPDERPLSEDKLMRDLQRSGLTVTYKSRHWDIFPHTLPPAQQEAEKVLALHQRYRDTGNCVTIIASKNVKRFSGFRGFLHNFAAVFSGQANE